MSLVDERKQRLLALVGKGEAFRDAGSPPLVPPEPKVPAPAELPEFNLPIPKVQPKPKREHRQPEAKPTLPKAQDAGEEPPPERPEIFEPAVTKPLYGVMPMRERRRGMRSDPAWQQKTIYLKRSNIELAEEIARLMGIDFSVLVDYALGLQVQAETRSPEIQKVLDQRRRLVDF